MKKKTFPSITMLIINVYTSLILMTYIPKWLTKYGFVGLQRDLLFHAAAVVLTFLVIGCFMYWLLKAESNEKSS